MTLEIIEQDVMGDFPYVIAKIVREEIPESILSKYNFPKFHYVAYVGLPKSHPWYGLHYDDEGLESIKVNGGLTFSDHEQISSTKFNKQRTEYLLRSVEGEFDDVYYDSLPKFEEPKPKEPYPIDTSMDLWWIGWDYAHSWDHDEDGNPTSTLDDVKEDVINAISECAKAWTDHHNGGIAAEGKRNG